MQVVSLTESLKAPEFAFGLRKDDGSIRITLMKTHEMVADRENTLHKSLRPCFVQSAVIIPPVYQLDFYSFVSEDVSLFSSFAVILGVLFVAFQIRENGKLIRASEMQAEAAAVQAKLSTEQLKQNNEIANMDMIMRLYEFANTAEVQSAWLTVLSSNVLSFEDFEKLSKQDQISFYQIASSL